MRLRDKGALLALLIPIVGLLPMLGDGLPNAADAPFHAHRIFAMARLIEAGDLYPRWVPYFHLGYGYPVFTYYAPGATHIGAWLHLLGINVVHAYFLATALAWCIGSIGVWLLARTYLPASAAFLACVLWVYAPSRFYEFWWQGSLAQTVSTSFIPLVFYAIVRARRHPSPRASLWIALPFSAIVLTHTPTTYIASIFLLPFSLMAALASGSRRAKAERIFFMGGGLALGAGLSAIFWLPVISELRYVKIGGELRDTIDFLKHSFPSFHEIFSLPQVVDSGDATLLMARTIGPIGVALSVMGLAALLLRRRFKLALLLFAGLLFALAMTLEQSLDIWLLLPGFRNLRFPERILRMASLLIALLGASSLLLFPLRWRRTAAVLLSILVIGQVLPFMRPRDDDKLWPALSAKDEIEMEFAEHNWGTTAYNEFQPIWGRSTPFDLPNHLDSYIRSPLQIHIYSPDFERKSDSLAYQHAADNQILITAAGDAQTLRLRQFYMPGWQLTVNGKSHPFRADDEFGLIQLRLPQGQHLLQLDYAGTPIQHLSAWISLLSVGAGILIFWRGRPSPHPQAADDAVSMRGLMLTGSGLILFAIVNTVWLQDNLFRANRDDGQPAYMRRKTDIAFDDAITLLGYTLHSRHISSSEALNIRLYWKLKAPPNAEYQPLVQLVDLTVSEAWAVSQPLNFEGGKITALAPGQFMSDGHSLKLFDHAPPYVGRISIQLVRGGETAELPDGSNRYLLPERVTIAAPSDTFRGQSRNIDFDGILTLHCIQTARTEDELIGTLHWQVLEQPASDYHHFAHGLNEEGTLITQNDGEPLDGKYPTSLWRKNQHIQSSFSLNLPEEAATIAFGLYNPLDGKRVPVTVDGQTHDHLLLTADKRACQP